MKRQHIEEEEEVLRQINEASDAIRRKYQMIKTGRADADRVYADILKPVVTPLKAFVEKKKPIELKKDLEIQDLEIKEEKGPIRSSTMEKNKRFIKQGKGMLPHTMLVSRGHKMDYVYWDDPTELVDRLQLLAASYQAGNKSHTNEIMSILEELRRWT